MTLPPPAQCAYHLLGIGGAGMSALATLLLEQSIPVSGSDLRESALVDSLRGLGAMVAIGHDQANVASAFERNPDRTLVVVHSSAVPENNPERLYAAAHQIPALSRAEALAEVMRPSKTVCVAGTHGKTTTTSMLTVALQGCGLDPSFMIGAAINEVGAAAHYGTDHLFVAEADESDRSFVAYSPDVAVITNVELDHPDEFATSDDVDAAFDHFVARLRPQPGPGMAVVGIDDAGGQRLAGRHDGDRVLTYGTNPDADLRLQIVEPRDGHAGSADLHGHGLSVAINVAIPGDHNLRNAAGALAAVHALGQDVEAAAKALSTFTGAARRFQRLGSQAGRVVVDDYAHHPTELTATIQGARAVHSGRVVVVVQPHRYSRTQALGEALGVAAGAADVVVVADVYASGEEPIAGVGPELVATGARTVHSEVHIEAHVADLPARLVELTEPGDMVLITGAGDISRVGPALLDALGRQR